MGEGEDDETVAELQAAVSISALDAISALCTNGADGDGVPLVDVMLFLGLCQDRVDAYTAEEEASAAAAAAAAAQSSPSILVAESLATVRLSHSTLPLHALVIALCRARRCLRLRTTRRWPSTSRMRTRRRPSLTRSH